ncbi:MAG: alpha-amylase family glycosyl hydrolase [Clostridia bacterium]|nr:alpha-amylase family glycosyl hydrolase [Clostridia bacterium]
MVEQLMKEVDFDKLCDQVYYKSPVAWEDQVMYFLMLDRFSNGNESGYKDNNGTLVEGGKTALFHNEDNGNAVRTEEEAKFWRESGEKWVGGTLKGLSSKLGYLKRLGITAVWVSPIFKQVAFRDSYHGYGIQNFLDVDPHFGTREDLKEMVKIAHENGIYVVMDIILNHTGDIFQYKADSCRCRDQNGCDICWDGNTYDVEGFKDESGNPSIGFHSVNVNETPNAWPNGAVWPVEFQNPGFYSKKGKIRNWDYNPEYFEGDFMDLKDIYHGTGDVDHYKESEAFRVLCEVYKYWIAYADIDGFRIDTVKHVDHGATRYFAQEIHEFAQSIGKENFYLIGEITGGREHAFHVLEITGIDAALGIADIPDKLENVVKGYSNPEEYFNLFRNSLLIDKESHVWFKNKVVTMFDDHDQVRRGTNKARFCASDNGCDLVLNALALNAATLGIPCIYYGSEQCFDGSGDSDRYIRESMFGGEFGAFRSKHRHFFNEDNWVYKELSKILEIRRNKIVLRRGRQYLRPISGDGVNFSFPHKMGDRMTSLVPWSRIFNKREMLVVTNTDCQNASSAWVTVDHYLNQAGDRLRCIYSSKDKSMIGKEVTVEEKNGKSVYLTLPACDFAIFEQVSGSTCIDRNQSTQECDS